LPALDELAPRGKLMRGAIHELLVDPSEGLPRFVAMIFARAVSGAIIWCDPTGELYPPAVAPFIPLDRLYLLHPKNLAEESWAVAECLRCRGVAAVVAAPPRLSRIEARRLQLAAERGGGAGILLRHFDRGANIYAASTRWLVSPCPGEATVQKWKIQLIHGHGGRVGQTVILEHHRETNLVRATEQLLDRSASTEEIRAIA
jgi:protein ImuA